MKIWCASCSLHSLGEYLQKILMSSRCASHTCFFHILDIPIFKFGILYVEAILRINCSNASAVCGGPFRGIFLMKQHEAVIEVMRANGGYATLGLLYQEALKIPDVIWNTKTPFKSINRIVQTHNEFFRVRPGLWALEEYRKRLPDELLVEPESQKPKIVEFNHGYYQGLLVQIGNLKKRGTFIPAQDKNRRFLETTLAEIATVQEFHPFGYPSIVNRARTIDVVWFNERRMPEAGYEVEHSTDIQNSLLKFVEMQDFYTQFYIVAPDVRKAEFEKKMKYEAFRPIVSRVKFLGYEKLSEWHTKIYELTLVENEIG
jgi:hypothetical protein